MPKDNTKPAGEKQARRGLRKATAGGRYTTPGAPAETSRMAQVRLRTDELARLQHSMRILRIPSTSDALREGLRLLEREANAEEAATEIRNFYGDRPAPLPDGAVPVDDADLKAVDDEEW